jgi:Na+/proline symporter
MSLVAWSWIFLGVYLGGMVALGLVGRARVRSADDFATARGAYGPLFLALAFAATAASGATFLGFPGLVYTDGASALWATVLYPAGIYLGVLLCMRLVARSGNLFGSRSIPEYIGHRYRSDGLRLIVAISSLLLLFYLAGQLVAGLVMFEIMLGLEPAWALLITTIVLLLYVAMGGAHADILTDGVQGLLMLLLAAGVVVMFALGFGVEGGAAGMFERVGSLDPHAVTALNPESPYFRSWFAVIAILPAHLPLGLLPHIGNKLWALRSERQRLSFVRLACTFGLLLAMLGLGGFLARAVLGDALVAEGAGNEALPALFIELFPPWLAALIGVGILAAVMSTADGLVVSSSQIIANDLYRCTFVPRRRSDVPDEEIDRRVLAISRWSTAGALVVCAGMAWMLIDVNIALAIWIGLGGMMAAFAGPLVLGTLWRGVTAAGAWAGLVGGLAAFATAHAGVLDPAWFEGTMLHGPASWLQEQSPNPISCTFIGEIVSVALTWIVSKLTRPLPPEHLEEVFG